MFLKISHDKFINLDHITVASLELDGSVVAAVAGMSMNIRGESAKIVRRYLETNQPTTHCSNGRKCNTEDAA